MSNSIYNFAPQLPYIHLQVPVTYAKKSFDALKKYSKIILISAAIFGTFFLMFQMLFGPKKEKKEGGGNQYVDLLLEFKNFIDRLRLNNRGLLRPPEEVETNPEEVDLTWNANIPPSFLRWMIIGGESLRAQASSSGHIALIDHRRDKKTLTTSPDTGKMIRV